MKAVKPWKRVAALAMALLLLLGTVPAFAAEQSAQNSRAGRDSVSVTIEVKVKVTGNSRLDSEAADAVSLVLTPEDASSPVPASTEITAAGEGTVSFDAIRFTETGSYSYTIRQKAGNDPDYLIDTTVYRVRIDVYRESDQLLHATMTISQEGQDGKYDGIVYQNEYVGEEEPEETPTTPTPSEEVTPTPTPSEEVTPTPTPSEEVTPTPTPSEEVTPTPTPSEEVTPTPTPSEEVTPTPTPSEEVTPTPSEEPQEEPTPVPSEPSTPEYVVLEELPDPNDPDSPEYVIIYEDGVPLAYHKEVDPETGEMIYVLIDDEDVPMSAREAMTEEETPAQTGGDSPNTGDETNNTIWIALLCAVAVGLTGCVWYLVAPKRRGRDQ